MSVFAGVLRYIEGWPRAALLFGKIVEIVKSKTKLEVPCEAIEDVEGEGLELTDTLFEVLNNQQGIGLAANQIGILKRACVITVPERDKRGNMVYWAHRFINPEIIEKKDPFIFTQEGCLSFPKDSFHTMRFGEILVKDSLRPDGVVLTDMAAVIAYHEIDHLDGITMHMRRPKSIGVNNECPCGSGNKFKRCCQSKLKERNLF